MVNMILKMVTGRRIAIETSNIIEMSEGGNPNQTFLLISYGRDSNQMPKTIVVDHPIEEIFERISKVRESFWA